MVFLINFVVSKTLVIFFKMLAKLVKFTLQLKFPKNIYIYLPSNKNSPPKVPY
jgi:hypothetical protein